MRRARLALCLVLSVAVGMTMTPVDSFATVDKAQNDKTNSSVSYSITSDQSIHKDTETAREQYDESQYDANTSAQQSAVTKEAASTSLPSSYDLRDEGYVSSVKSQSPWGTCWSFGALAASESSIMSSTGKSGLDLSERALAWFAGTATTRKESTGTVKEGRNPSGSSVSNVLDTGNTSYGATSVLAGGSGLIAESKAPYKSSKSSTWTVSESLRYSEAYRLKESSFLPSPAGGDSTAIKAIKSEIKNGRAVDISFFSSGLKNSSYNYYNKSKYAYYCNEQKSSQANHAVCIVGWNDNYSKKNFNSKNRPSRNGAWLVKNSWGKSWGKSGYFWISYYDTSLTSGTTYQYDSATSSEVLVQNDYLNNMYQYAANYSSKRSMANILSTDGTNGVVKSVSCMTSRPATTVTYQVYDLNEDYTSPTDGTLIAETSATYTYAGYHRESVNASAAIENGHKFSIVVTEKTSEGKYTVLLEMAPNTSSDYKFKGYISSGQSYVGTDGSWKDYKTYLKECSGGNMAYDNYPIRAYLGKGSNSSVESTSSTKVTQSVTKLSRPSVRLKAGHRAITVKYAKVSHAKKYKIRYKVKGGSWKTAVVTSKTAYKIKNLKKGKRYYVKVCAIGSGSATSSYSAAKSAKAI